LLFCVAISDRRQLVDCAKLRLAFRWIMIVGENGSLGVSD